MVFIKNLSSEANKLLLLLFMIITFATFGQVDNNLDLSNFLTNDQILFDTVYGDLNKDGIDDNVLITKGTDEEFIVTNRFDEVVDRNRRGIIILLKKNSTYEVALRNDSCFSSENEDGGIYFPPQLSLSIDNGNLYVKYGHGRYGLWQYSFKYQNSDFELIGYDSSYGGAVIESEISINFLTKKKLNRVNTNANAQGDDEIYEETWEDIEIKELIKLSEIKDFDELNMSNY